MSDDERTYEPELEPADRAVVDATAEEAAEDVIVEGAPSNPDRTDELPKLDESILAQAAAEQGDEPGAKDSDASADAGDADAAPVVAPPFGPDEVDKIVITPAHPDKTAPMPAMPLTAPAPPAEGDPSAAAVAADETDGPANAPGREAISVANRPGADEDTGSTHTLSWSARSDVGLVRTHNEDSFLVRSPLFCVCDGMGGHAAGEVASSIAIRTISENSPATADEALLGAAVELANTAVIDAAEAGEGKPGMGCTATAVLIEGTKIAIAHVGDSRAYILHQGNLVRITHDHSFVEELVDAGEITADEARIHPSRSIITRALGSDPDMYADHFSLDVEQGDRIIICSDGLSSMISDSAIEATAVSSATPKQATDNLVAAALAEGGHDNVTVVVIDILDDGTAAARRAERLKVVRTWLLGVAAVLALLAAAALFFVNNSWYIGIDGENVAIYQGVNIEILGRRLSTLSETTSIKVADLPEVTQKQLDAGIGFSTSAEARDTVESYRDQIDADKTKAAETASNAQVASADGAAAAEGEAQAEGESQEGEAQENEGGGA